MMHIFSPCKGAFQNNFKLNGTCGLAIIIKLESNDFRIQYARQWHHNPTEPGMTCFVDMIRKGFIVEG